MKFFLILLVNLLVFTSCASKNAFGKFNMDKDQELSANSLQSSEIKELTNTEGFISAIYLNNVYPDDYNQHEYFYVYLYQKDKKEMYIPNTFQEIELTLKLNSKLPIEVKELSSENNFSYLTSINGKWQRYFLITFKKSSKSSLNLVLESGQSSSDVLSYQKVKQ